MSLVPLAPFLDSARNDNGRMNISLVWAENNARAAEAVTCRHVKSLKRYNVKSETSAIRRRWSKTAAPWPRRLPGLGRLESIALTSVPIFAYPPKSLRRRGARALFIHENENSIQFDCGGEFYFLQRGLRRWRKDP